MHTVKARKPRTAGENLCPCCYGYGCDPMSTSRRFRQRVETRLRMGLCVACGEPKEFCKCRSNYYLREGKENGLLKTHNNKKDGKQWPPSSHGKTPTGRTCGTKISLRKNWANRPRLKSAAPFIATKNRRTKRK